MDKIQAQNLVKETFENSFDENRFRYFIRNLLNHFDERNERPHCGQYIPEAFRARVGSFERIGKYVDGENEIDILIVNLKKGETLERARSAQRNFIAWYLNGGRRGKYKDGALIAFVAPDTNDWRFSLVKMDYKFEEGSNGKTKVIQDFTPARRWSFLVGANENSHTAQSRLAPIVENDNRDPTLKELEEAFNIEKVTKEFFEKYRDLFCQTKDALDDLAAKDEKIKDDFETKSVNTVDFSKKLLGQIVFLYFLQKKGWFGVPKDKNWGEGDKKFLRNLFNKARKNNGNYFNDYLEPLFYEALAKERDDNYYSHFNCKIPFLNGGLFDPINNYDWVNTSIMLPDELFSNDRATKEGDVGDGILDIFDRYNFTVKEDEPLEKEVAIDPEMLGKVFENLLEVKDRKSKGTYYTPREIVHYMCQQSLINYLAGELEGKISKDDLEVLIKDGDKAGQNELLVESKGKQTPAHHYKLPESVRQNAAAIDEKLATIKVCDPAIGSGAFPVGMMNEIVKARETLSAYLKDETRTIYNFKRDCIQNSLYGVDIDPSAVEIAKLRLWLSLIVDEDDIKQIKPLPNLDYKIMQGNSLLEDLVIGDTVIKFDLSDLEKVDRRKVEMKNLFEKDLQGRLFKSKSDDIFAELRKLHALYFEENNKTKKLALKEKIDQKEQSLILAKCEEEIKNLESVQRNARDEKKITAAQQQIKNIKSTLENLQKQNSRPFFLWKLHFSEVFKEKGGFDVVIGNPPYISAIQSSKNEKNDREIYKKNYHLIKGAFDIYAIFLLKGIDISNIKGTYAWIIPNKFMISKYSEDVLIFLKQQGTLDVVSVSHLSVFAGVNVYPIIVLGSKSKTGFNYYEVNNISDLAKNILLKKKTTLGVYKKFKDFGIKIASGATGFQAKQLSKYISENQLKGSIPFVVSGSIDPWLIDFEGVRYMGKKYTNAFISKGVNIANSKWSFWIKEKIVISGMTKRIEATYSSKPLGLGVGIYAIYDYSKFNPKFILGILNSKFLTYYFLTNFEEKHLAGGYLAINKSTIEQLPLVDADIKQQKPFVEIVDKILEITRSGDYLKNSAKQAKVKEYETQIDQLVYKLYELTPEEVKIVEK
ncbi:MAG TPA: Eco57I restriction-modification methylase domain-containing protein [Candidatus Magasanikbacteria bacterium]|nr:Eco57I restriction-modification methylase domain-containing protein [Candidatus Magasanikbacteria bacterium]